MSIKRETLLCGILCLFAIIPAFADSDWLVAQTDKDQYQPGQEMEISGYIQDKTAPQITIKIYDPDSIILGAYNIEIQPDNTFSRTVALDSTSFSQSGLYIIEFDYGDNSDDLFFEVDGADPASTLIPHQSPTPEVLQIITDKNTYQDSEYITISGLVSDIDDPTILIGIFDPDNFPTGFYTPKINSDLEFEVSFLAKSGVNFKKTGTYTAKATYGTSKQTTTFGFADKPLAQNSNDSNNSSSPSIIPPQIILDPGPTQKQGTPKPQTPNPAPVYTAPTPVIQKITPIIQDIVPPKQNPKQETESNNLTAEQRQAGEVLNKLTLQCDGSGYTDSISYGQGMGAALMRLCSYDQAESYFDKALAKDPYNPELLTNKGSALAKQGKFDEALEQYETVLKTKPNFVSALNNKANILAQTGDLEQAIRIYNKILDRDATNGIVQQNLQSAKEDLLELKKSESKDDSISVNMDSSIPKIESAKVSYAKDFDAPKSANVFEQIGSIFAGFFGLLK